MDKRTMGQTGEDVSILGFGCMRFPLTADKKIDEIEAEKLLDAAYAAGVNYFDTAWPYHEGTSEPFVGRVLNKYDRQSYYLATKFPHWEVQTKEDAKRIFEKQLERLDKDYIDFYLLHALGKDSWEKCVRLGIVELFDEMKAAGKIRHYGFSFHHEYDVFETIMKYRKWDFVQIQLNYLDVDEQAGIKGYRLAEELGVPVIVMEPVKGGNLSHFPEEINSAMQNADATKSTASWALRWVADLPNVKLVLSGMTTMDQVKDNLATFSPFVPLTQEEHRAIDTVRDMLRKRVNNGCTACGYCMPCPYGVDIPWNFAAWNVYGIFRNPGDVLWQWGVGDEEKKKAQNCVECGACEDACPQHISIRKDLKRLQTELDTVLATQKEG